MRFLNIATALIFAGALHAASRDSGEHWVGTWAAAPQPPAIIEGRAPFLAPPHIENLTLREIVRVSIGGREVRVRFSNAYGTEPLAIGAAHIALRAKDSAILPESDHALSFGDKPSASIPPGALAVTDPVRIDLAPQADLAISVFLPGNPSSAVAHLTAHTDARQTTYVSPQGDFTSKPAFESPATSTSWFFLAGVEVKAFKQTGAVVAIGDSITDGYASTVDANHRWPDYLADRILKSGAKMAVLNMGISGNQVTGNGIFGENLQARFDRDVLAQSGVTHAIVLEGINDSRNVFVAGQIIAGLHQAIERAHARGIQIFGCTLTPAGSTGEREHNRTAVNDWIRSSKEFDAVIDFDAATRDPANPALFLPALDSGDHLHPNDAGYKVMAEAIDLKLLGLRGKSK